MGRRSVSLGALLLLGPLLSGCLSNTQVVQIGMLGSPLSYALGVCAAYGLCSYWRWREPQVPKRLPVLAVPALVLVFFVFSYLQPLSSQALSKELNLFFLFATILIPFMALPLMGISALVWRLWYALAPRSSLEGAALLSAALFFTPGILVSHDLLAPRDASELTGMMFVFCLYGGTMGTPVVLALLWMEAASARRRAQRAADPERLR